VIGGKIRGKVRAWLRQPRVSPLAVKAFTVGTVATAVAVPLALISVPYIDFFNDMAVQAKAKPQMVWRHEGAEAVPEERQPVRGTVPRDYFEYPFPTPPELREPLRESDDARRLRIARLDDFQAHAGQALEAAGPDVAPPYQPHPPTLASMALGRKRFETICIVCHGEWGRGDGRVASRGFPPPADLLGSRVRGFPDGRIFHVVSTGRNAMPSWARQLPPEERWAVVHYVRALQRAFPAAPPPDGSGGAPPTPPPPDAAAGAPSTPPP
jgi:mono/diheme cytochrome c family protein